MSMLNRRDLSVADVMLPLDVCPLANQRTLLKEVLDEMDVHRLGMACVIDSDQRLVGVITEGDLRRKLLRVQKPLPALLTDDVETHAIKTPITANPDLPLIDALALMSDRKIWDLPVVDRNMKILGLLHLHQALVAAMQLPD